MPIEIRELHIRAVIDGGAAPKNGGAAAAGGETATAQPAEHDTAELIDICVEKVLEILREQQER